MPWCNVYKVLYLSTDTKSTAKIDGSKICLPCQVYNEQVIKSILTASLVFIKYWAGKH